MGAIISLVGGQMQLLPFEEMINPETGRMRPRKVNVDGERYECARRYMIRLETTDFEDPDRLAKLAAEVGLTPSRFRERFEYLVNPDAAKKSPAPA